MSDELIIREASENDKRKIWRILAPIINAGETYALPRDWGPSQGLDYWFSSEHAVFVVELGPEIVGTYYLRPNQKGAGSHIANCGFITRPGYEGRGVARAMCQDAISKARRASFEAMQFNFVISSNKRSINLWADLGFRQIGCIPLAYKHPKLGPVDALIMYRAL